MSSNRYHKVNSNDKVHFVSNHDFDDSQVQDLKFAPRKSVPIKIACFRVSKKTFRRTLLALLCIVLLIFIILLIVKVSNRKNPPHLTYKSSNHKDFGLFYAPQNPDQSPIIRFELLYNSYKDLMKILDDVLHKYSMTEQLSKEYIDCTPGKNQSEDKVCRMPVSSLGIGCTHIHFYGFPSGQPCILLMLKLNDTEIPQPFTNSSTNWNTVNSLLGSRYSKDHIGITCDGVMEFDRKHILKDPVTGHSILYTPATGFPTYFFPRSTSKKYLPPVVMVQFARLMQNVPVNIRCVAWAENFNNGHPQSSEKYTAEFEITVES